MRKISNLFWQTQRYSLLESIIVQDPYVAIRLIHSEGRHSSEDKLLFHKQGDEGFKSKVWKYFLILSLRSQSYNEC